MSGVTTEWERREAYAKNWAHDWLDSDQYEDDRTLEVVVQAYMAGYERGIDV